MARTDSKADDAGLSRLFMIALRTGSANAVKSFLGRKINISATDGRGRSALIIAAGAGHLAICRLLIEAGSDPFFRDVNGLDASHHARVEGHDEVLAFLDDAMGRQFDKPDEPDLETSSEVLPLPVGSRPVSASFEPVNTNSDLSPSDNHVQPLVHDQDQVSNDVDRQWDDLPESSTSNGTLTSSPPEPDNDPDDIVGVGSVRGGEDFPDELSARAPHPSQAPVQVPSSTPVEQASVPRQDADADADSWEVDSTDLPDESDRSAVQEAGLVQARLSASAAMFVGGEDWSSVLIELPDLPGIRSELVLPNSITAMARSALTRAARAGEFQADLCDMPGGLVDARKDSLCHAVRQTAAAFGCVVDRPPDPWFAALSSTAGVPDPGEGIDDAVEAFATHLWSAGRAASYNARLDTMPPLKRAAEADLFGKVAQATAEAMLSLAMSIPAIDFILSADDLVSQAHLPFSFISSHPLEEQSTEDEGLDETVEDDEGMDEIAGTGPVELIELPTAYVTAMIELRAVRNACSTIMLPAETRRAASALRGLSLTPDFLAYLDGELPAVEANQRTMKAVFSAMRRADQARQVIIERHLPQTRFFAQRYRGQGLEFDDLVQEANIGLLRAIETFDMARGYRFWTYAQTWVWQRLNRAVASLGSPIRLPVHVHQDRRRLEVAIEEAEKSGIQHDVQHLATLSGLPVTLVRRLLGAWVVDLLEDLDDLAGDGIAGARIIDDAQPDPLASSLEIDLVDELHTAIEELPPRLADVVRMRFGLDDSQAHTLEEIGQKYGVTRERIRQLEVQAFKILKHPGRSRVLRTLLEH
ncbi:sigma-70 family RNA polymerase sigma factor [Sphingomonas prati]|uniref:RNA polymerase primary sigma factor n=1 Tax=Sphingomonas prati TaxID=1843237 RepID=A0A7W9F4M5_9SPHN|nr:sigma-70 family RNA polymerase sigma factor [Sphingomonas prati]MBB5730625.1 RNA polymerase primary sigma factor [Sphingomonas prati]GGE95520.1 hypothetical protein GCM10011404_30760 [Sphingomonas prati]